MTFARLPRLALPALVTVLLSIVAHGSTPQAEELERSTKWPELDKPSDRAVKNDVARLRKARAAGARANQTRGPGGEHAQTPL